MNCPCGTARAFANCCGRYLDGSAPDAEALMRSRYSAYVRGDRDYLLATWHPTTRPATLVLDHPAAPKWLGLEIRRHLRQDAGHASVEFVARWRVAGRGQRLHELSRFIREDGRWYYLDGNIDPPAK